MGKRLADPAKRLTTAPLRRNHAGASTCTSATAPPMRVWGDSDSGRALRLLWPHPPPGRLWSSVPYLNSSRRIMSSHQIMNVEDGVTRKLSNASKTRRQPRDRAPRNKSWCSQCCRGAQSAAALIGKCASQCVLKPARRVVDMCTSVPIGSTRRQAKHSAHATG
jgi:hypothetical protein